MSRKLLACIDDKGEQESLPHRRIFPKCEVRARDNFLLIHDSFTNGKDLILDLLFGMTNSSKGCTSVVNAVAVLDVPLKPQSEDVHGGNSSFVDGGRDSQNLHVGFLEERVAE